MSQTLPKRLSFALILCFSLALAQAAPVKLRLLATTDIHMNLVNYDYYQDKETEQFGLAKTATLIKAARAEAKNHLLIDNGDLIQGSPMGEVVARIKPLQPGQVHPAYLVMNALKYDAANVGNHEFNYGLPFLLQSLKTSAFPYVSSNVVDEKTGKPVLAPYVLLKRQFLDETGKLLPANSNSIVNLRHEGRAVSDDMMFLVVSNNYRTEGGGSFAGLDGKQIVFHAPDENREVLGRYMASEKTVNPNSDNNWQILPVPGVSLRFQTGAGAMRYLSRHPGLKLVSENSDGSVTLELVK